MEISFEEYKKGMAEYIKKDLNVQSNMVNKALKLDPVDQE